MESQDYTAIIKNLQRPINCLVDQDRNTRRSGLDTLNKELFKSSKDIQIKILLNTNLGKNLVHTLNDLIQMNREITLNILEKIFEGAEFKRQQSQVFIQSLISRINAHPFPEKSQDLRLKILKLIKICLHFKEGIVSNMGELASALTKCLGDLDSNIKNCACELINELSTNFKNVVGKYSTGLTKALSENLKHNKFQVRKTTLGTIAKLLVTQGAGGNFQHVQVGLKVLLSDAKAEVRKTALECIAYLIKYMAPKYLKQYQANLVSFMLVALSDEAVQNVNLCVKLLEECGTSIRQLYEEQSQMIAEQK